MQLVLHGDLGGGHVGPDLNLHLARHGLRPLRLEEVLSPEERPRAAHAGGDHDRGTERIELGDPGVGQRHLAGRQGEMGEPVGTFLDDRIHPVRRHEPFDHRPEPPGHVGLLAGVLANS